MIDANKILAELSKGGFGGGLLGGALSGALVSGKGGSLARLGGLAAIGALAYKAYQAHQQKQGAAAMVDPASNAASETMPGTVSYGTTLLRAMIAAAKSDGQIDAAENQKIFERLNKAGLNSEEKAFLLEELGRPLNLDAIVAEVRSPQQAAEIYAASRVVVADQSPAERAYLDLLAARLDLAPDIRSQLDSAVRSAGDMRA